MSATATKTKEVQIEAFGTVRIAYTGANRQESWDFAKAHGGRLFTYQGFIATAKANPEIFKKLEGMWFWLDGGKDPALSGYYNADAKKGLVQMAQTEWDRLEFNQQLYIQNGSGLLSMNVYPERPGSVANSGRMALIVGTRSDSPAPVVLYVVDSTGKENAKPGGLAETLRTEKAQ
jgi:hypothetical protein